MQDGLDGCHESLDDYADGWDGCRRGPDGCADGSMGSRMVTGMTRVLGRLPCLLPGWLWWLLDLLELLWGGQDGGPGGCQECPEKCRVGAVGWRDVWDGPGWQVGRMALMFTQWLPAGLAPGAPGKPGRSQALSPSPA